MTVPLFKIFPKRRNKS